MYICITGQLSRLELKNKAEKLFRPLVDLGFKLKVGLALSTFGNKFSPRFCGSRTICKNATNEDGDKMQLFTSIEHAARYLLTINGVEEVKHFLDVDNNEEMLREQERRGGDKSRSHIRFQVLSLKQNRHQWYRTISTCRNWLGYSEMTMNGFVIRTNEDTMIETIDLQSIINNVTSGIVVTPACDSFNGMNTRIAFVPSDTADAFLQLPFVKYRSTVGVHKITKPGSYFKKIYLTGGIRKMNRDHNLSVTRGITLRLPHSLKECKVVGASHDPGDNTTAYCARAMNLSYTSLCWAPLR